MSAAHPFDSDCCLQRRAITSPFGTLLAYASQRGVRAILFADSDPARHAVATATEVAPAPAVLQRLEAQLAEYFAGTRQQFDLPLDPVGTEFQQLAWQALREIPFGETRSYAQQAQAIGKPSAVRAIGMANSRNPLTIVVPCHRVIGADGSLTGFAGGLPRKRALLEHEGVLQPQSGLPFANGALAT
jgi:methylated-DNA-[protein]-cysteine S-methyltransferase